MALAQQIHGGIALPANVDINPPANVGTASANLNLFVVTGTKFFALFHFLTICSKSLSGRSSREVDAQGNGKIFLKQILCEQRSSS